MVDRPAEKASEGAAEDERFRQTVTRKENRKLRARREGHRGPWFWLGMFGLVGWSVAVPALLGIALGVWLDSRFDGRVSWTLTMLFVGAAMGCWTAWYWVKRESQRQ
jgi:ATP synthase protein I